MVIRSQVEPESLPTKELRRLIFDMIKSKGDEIFMVDGLLNVEVTYRELYQKATSVAMFLNKADVEKGVVVGLLSDVTIESNIFLTGVWLSGGILCPMNPDLKPDEIRQLLDICGAKAVFCQTKYLSKLEEALAVDEQVLEVMVITDGPSASCIDINDIMNDDPTDFEVDDYDENEISHILFTSGTTGVPKGVLISNFSAKYTAFRFGSELEGVKGDIAPFMCTSPLYWISYVAIIVWTLTRGSKIIVPRTKIIPGTNQPDIFHVLDCIQTYKPRNWFTSPSMLLDLCSVGKHYDLSSLNMVGVGGSHLLPVQRKQICDTLFGGRRILFNMYGSTEVGVVTRWPPGEAPEYDSARAGSAGILSCGVDLKIIDPDTGLELGAGELGEMVVRSRAIMKGYINKELPARYSQDDWYHMGDIGWYDEDGYLYFSSRLKEIMKYRGFHIAPPELEKVILQHPGVQEVCVVGRPHPIDGELPAAFVVRKSDDVSEQDILDFVHERVIDQRRLRGGVHFVESIPKSGVGKTLRRELLKLFTQMDSV